MKLNWTYFIPLPVWKIWTNQRDNQNTYIKKRQKIQWPKENGQKDPKIWFTEHYTEALSIERWNKRNTENSICEYM